MNVVLVRHGDAERPGEGGDAGRTLTEKGRQQVRTTARALTALGLTAGEVLTSPLVRAAQSAEVLAEAHGGPPVTRETCLAPPIAQEALLRRLDGLLDRAVETVALVGHAPSLDEFLGLLIAETPRVAISLSKAGAACVTLEKSDAGTDVELRWLMRREQLARLA